MLRFFCDHAGSYSLVDLGKLIVIIGQSGEWGCRRIIAKEALSRLSASEYDRLTEDRHLVEWRNKMRGFAKGALFGRARSVVSTSDVLQESLLQVWQNAEFLTTISDRHAHSWGHRVVMGNVAKVLRYFAAKKRSAHSELRNIDISYEPVDGVADNEELGQLALAVETLPPTQRSILYRVVFDDQSFSRIARETGLSASKVRRLYLAAVKQLQSLFTSSHV